MQHSFTKKNLFYGLLLVGLWIGVHVFLFWYYGIRSFYDAKGYVQGADYLLNNGAMEDVHHVFYCIPIALIAVFRFLFPGEVVPFLIFQSVVSGLAGWALFKSSEHIFKNRLAGFLSAVFFLIWWDNIHWNIVTMTESLSRSAICFMILVLTNFKGTRIDFVKIAILCLVLFFIRPTGVIIILGVIAFCTHYYWEMLEKRRITLFTIFLIFSALAYCSADQLFSRWDFTQQYVRGNIVTYADQFKQIPAYRESLQIDVANVKFDTTQQASIMKIISFVYSNPIIFFKAAVVKVWFLVSGTRPYYSMTHNIFVLGWLVMMYGLYHCGWRICQHRSIRIFTLAVILINCALIGGATVDWDNRFYIPMEPGIILLAGGGASVVIQKILGKASVREIPSVRES